MNAYREKPDYNYNQRRRDPVQETVSEPAGMAAEEKPMPKKGVIDNAHIVRVRMSPSPNSNVITNFLKGTEFLIQEVTDDYVKVKISDEVSGYVMRKFVRFLEG